ncbi:hypothetical protein OUZ56_026343 [Daphnia magna]|uniref:Uncharacterized protein n=1 Tax=Daphnia magna TaxID=35525 RepID=A0ABQ9ZLF8_9CRUS|nr:hypothetical protein OUZ56_026343 [Daphnia magna]
MSELLLQQAAVEVKASMTHDQIVRLLDSSSSTATHQCASPYEWVWADCLHTAPVSPGDEPSSPKQRSLRNRRLSSRWAPLDRFGTPEEDN